MALWRKAQQGALGGTVLPHTASTSRSRSRPRHPGVKSEVGRSRPGPDDAAWRQTVPMVRPDLGLPDVGARP